MIVKYIEIYSLNEVDYDTLFNDSVDKLSELFHFRPDVTLETKRQIYKTHIERIIIGGEPMQKPGDTLMMYKVVADNKDVSLSIGYIESVGNIFRHHCLLSSPDSLGSRSWIYTKEALEAKSTFFSTKNISTFRAETLTNTPIYSHIQSMASSNNYVIDEELPSEVKYPDPNKQTKQLIIKF